MQGTFGVPEKRGISIESIDTGMKVTKRFLNKNKKRFKNSYWILDIGAIIFLIMFFLNTVDYPMSLFLQSAWTFLGWKNRGDHSKMFRQDIGVWVTSGLGVGLDNNKHSHIKTSRFT